MNVSTSEHANDDGDDATEAEDAGSAEPIDGGENNIAELPIEGSDAEAPQDVEIDPEMHAKALRVLEAILFASAEPMTERMLANRLPEGADVKALLKELQAKYDGGGVNLNRSGNSWAFRTAPDLSDFLNKEVEVARKLSRAAIETLAIIAYHQPVTRAEIEEIRGVSISKGTMDVLLEAEWIKPRGRRQTPGRPLQWGTTDEFLDHFGLEKLRDLPGTEELKAAGLLDASPAINAYRSSAGIEGDAPDEEGAPVKQEDALPDDALDQGEEEPDEPLDPEGLES